MKTIIFAVLFFAPVRGLRAESWTLERYLAEVFASSYDLKKAEEDVTIASNEYLSALAGFFLPALSLNLSNAP